MAYFRFTEDGWVPASAFDEGAMNFADVPPGYTPPDDATPAPNRTPLGATTQARANGLATLDGDLDLNDPASLSALVGKLTDAQRAYYEQNYKPFEDMMFGQVGRDGQRQTYERALADMGKARSAYDGMFARNNERYGVALDERSAENAKRRSTLASMAAQFNDAALLRDGLEIQRVNALGKLASSGRSMANNSLAALGNAASAAEQRRAQNEAQAQQAAAANAANRRQSGSLIGSIVGTGLSFVPGLKPIAGLIGTGIGAALS